MAVFESIVNVFSPWNQMADALSMAASIFAVIAFGCSSVPAVLSFPQAARVVTVTSVNTTEKRLANAATTRDFILFIDFMVVSPILCLSVEKVAS